MHTCECVCIYILLIHYSRIYVCLWHCLCAYLCAYVFLSTDPIRAKGAREGTRHVMRTTTTTTNHNHNHNSWLLEILVNKISFSGIPNSRNVLFLQIFLKRAAKPSAGNTSAGFLRVKWTWPGLASATFSGTLLNLMHQSLPHFCGTFSRHSSDPPARPSPEPSPEPCWHSLALQPSHTFSGTFSGILLNVTWLCTKASQTFSGIFSGTLLNLTLLGNYTGWRCGKRMDKNWRDVEHFRGCFCHVWGLKLVCVLLIRRGHKSIWFVLCELAGCKMWQEAGETRRMWVLAV